VLLGGVLLIIGFPAMSTWSPDLFASTPMDPPAERRPLSGPRESAPTPFCRKSCAKPGQMPREN
jgi:hypothetical protein